MGQEKRRDFLPAGVDNIPRAASTAPIAPSWNYRQRCYSHERDHGRLRCARIAKPNAPDSECRINNLPLPVIPNTFWTLQARTIQEFRIRALVESAFP
jgi:hypothetical protein